MEYGLIGTPLGHSLSPKLHALLGGYPYELRELAPAALGEFLRRRDFRGINVTLPYKQAVIPYLDGLDGTAARIGAVNTVVNRNGRLIGYNTDLGGLTALLARAGVSLAEKKVLILGTGGASLTALAAAKDAGAAEIVRSSRTEQPDAVTYAEAKQAHRNAQILINATPVGMWPHTDAQPISLADYPALEAVVDLIYNPLRTRLVLEAEALGIPAVGGLYMLVRQAALACSLFIGRPVDDAAAEHAYRALIAEQTNPVLIGMPTSGKTSVGTLLAAGLNRPFFDSDAEIVRRTGKPIPQLFAEEGEAAFRAREAEVLRELSGKTGCVIATGGGAVLDRQSVLRLKQNGRLYFLDRPQEALIPTPEHPLSDSAEKLMRLYEARLPLYRAAADETVRADGDPAALADEIKTRFLS